MAVAQPTVAVAERGDLALVPYYTVRGEWVTGIHIVNTSERTQVVKVRFRRATDSMDALDFNVVMSPRDVYAGFLSDDENGAISWSSPDTTCTVPATQANRLTLPPVYRVGAESGYVEIIAMGQAETEQQPIAVAAKHSAATATPPLTPRDCAAVRSNFFADGRLAVAANPAAGTAAVAGRRGVVGNNRTFQPGVPSASNPTIRAGGTNTYTDSGNVLKVSYFIRDNATGIEFGDNAVHIADFLGVPSITNQVYGVISGDLNGFDFPDLDGTGLPRTGTATGPNPTIVRNRFNLLRRTDVLGAESIINEWSVNPANGVEMDWVVTLPGQYTMLRLPQYRASLGSDGAWVPTVNSAGLPVVNPKCPRRAIPATGTAAAVSSCDYRDMPVQLTYEAYNREEFKGEDASTLVVSPQAPTVLTTYLPKEVNVITFGGNSVLGQSDANVTADLGQPFGWLEARLSPQTNARVCAWNPAQDAVSPGGTTVTAGQALAMTCTPAATGKVPVIGFAAWSRQVAANPDASYGRIVEHSLPGSNIPPRVADAGEDQFVSAGDQVVLNAEVSDTDGRIESIQWRQISGPEVTLNGADTARASFTAPAPVGEGFVDLEFEVTARDDKGQVVGRDTVRVRVALAPPRVVDAGEDQFVLAGEQVLLNAEAGAAGGRIESIQWRQISGPEVTLNDADTARASFTAPAPVGVGFVDLEFEVTARDDQGRVGRDTVRVRVTLVPPRVVDAGEDQFVLAGQQVLLNAEASAAGGRIESIQWRQISGPEVTLSDADTAQASFTAPAPTGGVRFVDLEFEVTARDDQGRVGRDTVRVRVALVLENSRPGGKIVVFVGPVRSVDEESTVRLSGVAIATGKAVVASQTWTQTSGQPTVNLVNAGQPSADFEAPKLPKDTAKRDLTFKFEATGNPGGTANKSVTITVRDINNRAPSMTSPNRANLKTGDWRVFELTAEDGDTTGEPIRFKLGGKDKALFTVDIDGNKSVLHFKTPPQGDTPLCSETPCVITITPSDGINKGNPQTVTITVAPPPPPKRLLNDTGVNFSGYSRHTYDIAYINPATTRIDATTCVGNAALGAPQDCDQGRDSVANLSKIGAGEAGFDFTKLGRNGQVLAIQNASYAANGQESLGTQWSCVRDNHTGFVWEVKTRDGSVHDRARLFSATGFFLPPESRYNIGTVNQLLQAANSGSGLCGFKDWRVPNLDELSNIVLRKKIPGNNQPAIDTDFFPNTQSGGYFSASPATRIVPQFGSPMHLTMRFVGSGLGSNGFPLRLGVNAPFVGGTPGFGFQTEEHPVRLVRGAPALSQTSNSRYVINGDGTVTDQVTQLMWQRCRHGRSGADCTTSTVTGPRANLNSIVVTYGWREIMRAAASSRVGGFSDWRVPNINELESLADYRSHSFNSSAFPNLYSGSNAIFYSSGPVPSYQPASDRNSHLFTQFRSLVWGFRFGSGGSFSRSHLVKDVGRALYYARDEAVYGGGAQAIFVRDVGPSDTDTPLVAPGRLLAIADDSQVNVSWTAVTGATGYWLYYSQSPISAVFPGDSRGVKKLRLSTAPTISNPFTVYELTNEKRYYFRATAIGADNAESAPSSQDSALPSKYPRLRTIER